MGDLEPAGFALDERGHRELERLEEERADEVRLELARLGPLHVLADALDVGALIISLASARSCSDLLQLLADRGVDDLGRAAP